MTTTPEKTSIALPANHVPGPKQGHWTYAEYARLADDGNRYEIMNGVLIMAPAPSLDHQGISALLTYYLLQAVQFTGLGRVLPAPVDVELTPERVVQPDVLVLLNVHLHRMAVKKVVGAPDLVVEIASPGTAIYDRLSKYDAYEAAGVLEYWLVTPEEQSVEVVVLEQGSYQSSGVFKGSDILPSRIAPEIASVHVKQFFV